VSLYIKRKNLSHLHRWKTQNHRCRK